MKNPACICDVVLDEAFEADPDAWILEETHRVQYGHCASCHHRSPEPKGILSSASVTMLPYPLLPVPLDVAISITTWADRERLRRTSDTATANAAMSRWWSEHRSVAKRAVVR